MTEAERQARITGQSLGRVLQVANPSEVAAFWEGINEGANHADDVPRRNTAHSMLQWETRVDEPLQANVSIEVQFGVTYEPVPWAKRLGDLKHYGDEEVGWDD